VEVESVEGILNEFVGTAKAKHVWRYNPIAGGDEAGDHLAVKVAPRRLPQQLGTMRPAAGLFSSRLEGERRQCLKHVSSQRRCAKRRRMTMR
jgi:hypothetical protein